MITLNSIFHISFRLFDPLDLTSHPDIQYEIALKIRKRLYLRETFVQEAGLDSDPGSQAPDGSVVAL